MGQCFTGRRRGGSSRSPVQCTENDTKVYPSSVVVPTASPCANEDSPVHQTQKEAKFFTNLRTGLRTPDNQSVSRSACSGCEVCCDPACYNGTVQQQPYPPECGTYQESCTPYTVYKLYQDDVQSQDFYVSHETDFLSTQVEPAPVELRTVDVCNNCKLYEKRSQKQSFNLTRYEMTHFLPTQAELPYAYNRHKLYQDDVQSQEQPFNLSEPTSFLPIQVESLNAYNYKPCQGGIKLQHQSASLGPAQRYEMPAFPLQVESLYPCNYYNRYHGDGLRSLPTMVPVELSLSDSYETMMDGSFDVTELVSSPSYDLLYTSTPSLVPDNTIHYTVASMHMPPVVSDYQRCATAGDPTVEYDSSVVLHNEEGEVVPGLHKMSPLLKKLEVMSNIITTTCDHNGGILTSKDGDLKLTIPKGAIKEGDLVTISIATSLFGPFVLPSHCQDDLASPYYWIGVYGSYHFEKLVQVEFEHFAVVTACHPSHFKLLTCEDDESYTMQPVDCELSFRMHCGLSWCSFYTNHFCSYCLYRKCKDPMINRIGTFFLKPKNFQFLDQFTVEIWFSFPISHCLKRNEELYTSKGMILDTKSTHTFEASCDKRSTSYFELSYDRCVDDWLVDHFRNTKIPTKDVNFYNFYTNKEDLRAMEEISVFPQRFTLSVEKQHNCNNHLNRKVNIALRKTEETKSLEFVCFELFVPIYLSIKFSVKDSTIKGSTTYGNNSIPIHQCNENAPEVKDLIKYSTKISLFWQQVAIQLGLSKDRVFTIGLDHQRTEQKCLEVFNTWLNKTIHPCWCHFIQALCDVGLNGVAEEAKTHLKLHNTFEINRLQAPKLLNVVNLKELGEPPNADDHDMEHQLEKFLKDVPDYDLQYFITRLLPKDSAVKVIKDIRYYTSGQNKEDNIKKICQAFLKEREPSWTKVHKALKDTKCDDLAELIEACFL